MQNVPKQTVYVRPPATPKLKNDWLTILLKALLFGGIFFSMYFSGKRNFNLLFAYIIDPEYVDYFAQISGMPMSQVLAMFEGGAMAVSFKIIYPLIISAIALLIYTLYAKFFAYLVFNQFRFLDAPFEIRKFRICLDSSMILLSALIGVSKLIFDLYPVAGNLGPAIVDVAAALAALAVFFFCYTRGMEKKFYPVLLNVMLIPSICLVIFV
ncbi:MAG: hypothetical protein K2I78_02300 [Clostridia bacterium]|nr:hypothetical protein [Clostridia bacterium]